MAVFRNRVLTEGLEMAVFRNRVLTEALEMAVFHNRVLTEALEMAVFRNLAPTGDPATAFGHTLTRMDPAHTPQPQQAPTTSRDCIVKASPAPAGTRLRDLVHNRVHTRGVVLLACIDPFPQPSCQHQHRRPSVPLVFLFHCRSFQDLVRVRVVRPFHNLAVDTRLYLFRGTLADSSSRSSTDVRFLCPMNLAAPHPEEPGQRRSMGVMDCRIHPSVRSMDRHVHLAFLLGLLVPALRIDRAHPLKPRWLHRHSARSYLTVF